MELRHLRYFIAVAEEEHVTNAARRLGIQQPPLSHQIRLLEEEIGVELFERKLRRVKLNPAGKVFLSEARNVLTAAERAVQRTRDFNRGKEGSIRVGMTGASSSHPKTLQIIRSYKATYPLINLKIEEGDNYHILQLVEEEILDVAFVRTVPRSFSTLSTLQIDNEPMIACIPIDFGIDGSDLLNLRDINHYPFVRYRGVNGPGEIWKNLDQACRSCNLELNVVDEVPRIMSAIHLASAGFGITIVPSSLSIFASSNVMFRPLAQDPLITVPLTIGYRSNHNAKALSDFLKVAGSMAG